MRLFVDTSALAAWAESRDPKRRRVMEFLLAPPSGCRLVTSNLVFAETMTLLSSRYGQDSAIRFGDVFLSSRMFEGVRYADEALERAALAVLRRYRDKRLSFTDASSIAIVKSEGLDGVFGFDEDFARCGIPLYPRPAH